MFLFTSTVLNKDGIKALSFIFNQISIASLRDNSTVQNFPEI